MIFVDILTTMRPNHIQHFQNAADGSDRYSLQREMHPPKHTYAPPSESMTTLAPPKESYLPPNEAMSTMHPPEHNYSPPSETMSKMVPPKQGYLPPKSLMSTMIPPRKTFLPPSKAVSTMTPPTHAYLPPKKGMSSMLPPDKSAGYVPPNKMNVMNPPKKEYFHPNTKIYLREQASIGAHMMKPPEVDYLPPHEAKLTGLPDLNYFPPSGLKNMKPPEKGYEPPKTTPSENSLKETHSSKYDGMTIMQPPKQSYLPPPKMDAPKVEYLPPKKLSYMGPPEKNYLAPHEMTYMSIPRKEYRPLKVNQDLEKYANKMKTIEPPKEYYLPPNNMKRINPPEKDYYLPPKYMRQMTPPNKDPPSGQDLAYLTPARNTETMKPPVKEYVSPQGNVDKMKIMVPPDSEYYMPKKTELNNMHHMSLPEKPYLPPTKMSTLHPPNKSYLPPVRLNEGAFKGMNKLQPPKKSYLPPTTIIPTTTPSTGFVSTQSPPVGKFIGTIVPLTKQPNNREKNVSTRLELSKAHYQACPSVTERPKDFCTKNYQHACWALGKRSQDCPLNGLCCFDGCYNMCLPPDYEHNPRPRDRETSNKAKPYKQHNVCPSLNKTIECSQYEGRQHQCNSPGISDSNCPGHGLCCNNGCINICILGNHELHNFNQVHWHHHQHHHHHHGPINYYNPPHNKYLVPSSVYIPREIVHDDEGNIRQFAAMNTLKYVPDGAVGEDIHDHLSQTDLLSPTSDIRYDGTSPAPLYMEAPQKEYEFPVPAESYLPPRKTSLSDYPEDEVIVDEVRRNQLRKNELKHMEPPSKQYLLPHNEKEHRHSQGNILHLGPVPSKHPYPEPSNKYLPPSKEYENGPDYSVPLSKLAGDHVNEKELLPPNKPSESYLPPTIPYDNTGKDEHHSPKHPGPNALAYEHLTHYLVPARTTYQEPTNKYSPPSENYDLPVVNKEQEHDHENDDLTHLLPPALISRGRPSNSYLPPSKSYIRPNEHQPEHHVNQHHNLPPSPSLHHVPSKTYLPPAKAYDKPILDEHRSPESVHYDSEKLMDYSPPAPLQVQNYAAGDQDLTHYAPPSSTSHDVPPSNKYLPPTKEFHSPSTNIPSPVKNSGAEDLTHYIPPPQSEFTLSSHYRPPKEEYLPPILPSPATVIAPPNANYLPPLNSGKPIVTHEHVVNGKNSHSLNLDEGAGFPFTPVGGDAVNTHHIVISDGHRLSNDGEGKIIHPHRLPPHSINIQINIPNKDEVSIGKVYDEPPIEIQKPPLLPKYIPMHDIKFPPQKVMKKSDHSLSTLHPPSLTLSTPKPFEDEALLSLDHIKPPEREYLPPLDVLSETIKDDYLPPPVPITILHIPEVLNSAEPPPPPPPEVIAPEISDVTDALVELGGDYLPPKNPQKYGDYVPPPPREELVVTNLETELPPPPPPTAVKSLPQVINSQALPPIAIKEAYIPPKTANDVPKNFIRPEEVPPPPPPSTFDADIADEVEDIAPVPTAFLGLAKLKNEETIETKSEKIDSREPKLPPMPTSLPPGNLLPFLNKFSPRLLQSLRGTAIGGLGPTNSKTKIPGVPGKDYPDFKFIPSTEFTCENFILEGFYADTFTGCQVSDIVPYAKYLYYSAPRLNGQHLSSHFFGR